MQRDGWEEHDDVEPVDPEVQRVKRVLFLATMAVLVAVIVGLLAFGQPDTQLVVTRHPNGHRATATHYVLGLLDERIAHGQHRAWSIAGLLVEEGAYDRGAQVGAWRFWHADGVLDEERSGWYQAGERVRSLVEGER